MSIYKQRPSSWKAPPALDPVVDSMQPIDVGAMSIACKHCGALFWRDENKWCCRDGKVKFERDELPPQVPDLLFELLATNSHEAEEFRKNIRQYNAALAMTSMGSTGTMVKRAAEDRDKAKGKGPLPVFKVHGELYHLHVSVSVP